MRKDYRQVIQSEEQGWTLTERGQGTLTLTKPKITDRYHLVYNLDATCTEPYEIEVTTGTKYLWQMRFSAGYTLLRQFRPGLRGLLGTSIDVTLKAPSIGTSFLNVSGWDGI